MSRFISKATSALEPYTPGEQPRDSAFIKLNTNENPYPPSSAVTRALNDFEAGQLRLYPDPTALELRRAVGLAYGLRPEQIFAGGGSDEVLAYAFMAFFDRGGKVYFPDITYGFYKVYAQVFGLAATELPLKSDFSVDPADYFGLDGNIFLANPNAPTGMCLKLGEIEEILRHNPDRLVVIDEAYTDFADGKSCLGLISRYDNLLVSQTFSKSRGLAGMRLGLGFGNPELIQGLERIKYSFNPYNIDRVSLAAGIASVKDADYAKKTAGKIVRTRQRVRQRLMELGFEVLPSEANFLFVKSGVLSGKQLYEGLKRNGVLVRHFDRERIADYVRVTVGNDDEMDIFLNKLEGLL